MKPGEGFLLLMGISMLGAGAGIFLWNLHKLFSTKLPEKRWECSYYLVFSCYFLGVGCKFSLLGPEFFRFHLSDFGFPSYLALMLFRHSWKNFIRSNGEVLKQHWIEQTLVSLQRHRSVLLVGFA